MYAFQTIEKKWIEISSTNPKISQKRNKNNSNKTGQNSQDQMAELTPNMLVVTVKVNATQ